MQEHNNYRYFLELGFDGTAYHGWQIQPNAISIQQILDEAISMVLREKINLTGAGRTDAGVHAKRYTAHFNSLHSPALLHKTDLVYKLNHLLPPDIALYNLYPVREDAHARYSAISRSYEYRISRRKDPFLINKAWLQERKMDFEAIQEATAILFEYEDFECFSKSNTQVNNYRCKIVEAHWRKEEHQWIFTIRANRFLRNMVRAIVGTLADVGLGKINAEQMKQIIESKNRSNAGYSVPGCGLYFMGAEYDRSILLL